MGQLYPWLLSQSVWAAILAEFGLLRIALDQ